MYKLLCMSRIASSPLLPTLRMNSIRGAYVPCSKRTCLIGSAGGERKMCPKRVILRLRHASESLTWLYLDVSASVLITLRFVHSRSTCVGGTCRTRLSIFIWNASIRDCSALVSCIVSRPYESLLNTTEVNHHITLSNITTHYTLPE